MRISFTFLLALFISSSVSAQLPEVYGLLLDGNFTPGGPPPGNNSLVRHDLATDSVEILRTIPGNYLVAYGSRAFDHGRNRFIYYGIDSANVNRFYSVPTDTGAIWQPVVQQNPAFGSQAPKNMEYDLQSDSLYGTIWNPTTQEEVFVSIDLQTGVVSEIAVLNNVGGSVNYARTFDSNHHQFIFHSFEQTANGNIYRLITVDASTGAILHQPVIHPDSLFWMIEYDNNTDKLFAISNEPDLNDPSPIMPGVYYTRHYVVELDPVTGARTKVNQQPFMEGYMTGQILGTADFDQTSRMMIFCSRNDQGQDNRIYVDVATGTQVYSAPMNEDFRMLQVSNLEFARQFYDGVLAQAPALETEWAIGPNPFQSQLLVTRSAAGAELNLQVLGLDGRLLREQPMPAGELRTELDLADLPQGGYLLLARSSDRVEAVKRIVKQ